MSNKNLDQYKELRKEILDSYIEVDQSTICSLKKVTISPNNCFKIKIGDECVSKKEGNGTIRLNANFTGPINPDKYFKSTKRILFILKESYIRYDSFCCKINPDRGGNDQSRCRNESPLSGDGSGDKTYKNIIAATYKIFKGVDCNFDDHGQKNEAFDLFRENVCIVNVNPFPGIANENCNTNDRLIEKWAIEEINVEMFMKQLELYDPKIIYGGNTVRYFRDGIIEYDGVYEVLKINTKCKFYDKDKSYVFKGIEKDVLIIDGYHPSYYSQHEKFSKMITKSIDLFR